MFQAITKFFRVTALWVLILPSVFTFIGTASNQLVFIANHDRFPVAQNDYRLLGHVRQCQAIKNKADQQDCLLLLSLGMLDEVHCVATHNTKLNWLADWIDFHEVIYSPGDLLLQLGDWLGGFCIFVWMALVVKSLNRKATV